ncbi:MAG: hypothetical protein ACYTFW_00235 [Planctomycetota bacterium]
MCSDGQALAGSVCGVDTMNSEEYRKVAEALEATMLWFKIKEDARRAYDNEDCPMCNCEAPFHNGLCPYLRLKEAHKIMLGHETKV